MKLHDLLACTLKNPLWSLFNYTENEALWTTAPLAPCGLTMETDPAQHHTRVTMIRAKPKPTCCKSLKMLFSSSTFDLGSAHLLMGCVLTNLKQEASWTGNLCKHLAETEHSDSGGDTFWKREKRAGTYLLAPEHDWRLILQHNCSTHGFIVLSQKYTASPLTKERLQPSWSVQNNPLARLWRYQSSQT